MISTVLFNFIIIVLFIIIEIEFALLAIDAIKDHDYPQAILFTLTILLFIAIALAVFGL